MIRYIIAVDGMQCGMCEAHVNEAIRKSFPVKKVASSHSKKQTVLLAQSPIDEDALKQTIRQAAYTALSVRSEPYEERGLFSACEE